MQQHQGPVKPPAACACQIDSLMQQSRVVSLGTRAHSQQQRHEELHEAAGRVAPAGRHRVGSAHNPAARRCSQPALFEIAEGTLHSCACSPATQRRAVCCDRAAYAGRWPLFPVGAQSCQPPPPHLGVNMTEHQNWQATNSAMEKPMKRRAAKKPAASSTAAMPATKGWPHRERALELGASDRARDPRGFGSPGGPARTRQAGARAALRQAGGAGAAGEGLTKCGAGREQQQRRGAVARAPAVAHATHGDAGGCNRGGGGGSSSGGGCIEMASLRLPCRQRVRQQWLPGARAGRVRSRLCQRMGCRRGAQLAQPGARLTDGACHCGNACGRHLGLSEVQVVSDHRQQRRSSKRGCGAGQGARMGRRGAASRGGRACRRQATGVQGSTTEHRPKALHQCAQMHDCKVAAQQGSRF